MNQNGRGATRKDVAQLARVAPATVSLVLNDHPVSREIPESTRKRILRAAASLAYRPSSVARSLVSGKTHTIGVVLHFLGSPFQPYTVGILHGAWDVFRTEGFRLLVNEGSAEQEAGHLFFEKCVDGVLILAPPMAAPKGEFAAIVEGGFPAVLVGASLAGDPLDYADIDNVDAGRRATERLLAAGHRRILHITGPLDRSSAAADRLKGCREAMAAGGAPVDDALVGHGDWMRAAGREAARTALAAGVRFTAVFAANDGMAAGAIDELLARGLRVPADVSVIGINGLGEALPRGMELATIRQPLEAIGTAAAAMLIERIRGERRAPRQRLISGEGVEGNTVAPLSG